MTVNNKDQSPAGNAPKQHLTKDEMREKIKASLAAKEATEFQPSSPKRLMNAFPDRIVRLPAALKTAPLRNAPVRTRHGRSMMPFLPAMPMTSRGSNVHHSRSTSSVLEATWQQHSVHPALHRPDITNQCGRSPTPERSASSLVLPCWLYSCWVTSPDWLSITASFSLNLRQRRGHRRHDRGGSQRRSSEYRTGYGADIHSQKRRPDHLQGSSFGCTVTLPDNALTEPADESHALWFRKLFSKTEYTVKMQDPTRKMHWSA